MKVRTLTCLSFLVIFSGTAILTIAQEQVIDKEQFDSMANKAREMISGKPFRSISRKESVIGGKTTVSTSTSESLPPDRSRNLNTTTSNGVTKTTEIIRVTGKIFERRDGGVWAELPVEQGGFGSVGGVVEKTETYKKTPGIKVGNRITDLYERYIVTTTANHNDQAKKSTSISWHWIDKTGRQIKSEFIDEWEGGKSHIETSFEYDIELKIEVPTVGKAN